MVGIDLSRPVLYQSFCGDFSYGNHYLPLVRQVLRLSQNGAIKDGVFREFVGSITPTLAATGGANWMLQHIYQHSWDIGNGEELTTENLRNALDSSELQEFLTCSDAPEYYGLNAFQETLAAYMELSSVLRGFLSISDAEEVPIIDSLNTWERFKVNCTQPEDRIYLSRGGMITSISRFFVSAKSHGLIGDDLGNETFNSLGQTLSNHQSEVYSFAPRGYISGDEIMEWLHLSAEYNLEWANSVMDWMRSYQ